MERGLIHIYCGDGKGKTSAATGLSIRAAGRGLSVLFARFLKNDDSGELRILETIPEIRLINPEKSYGFYRTLTDDERKEMHQVYRLFWEAIRGEISGGEYDMLVMDEFMAAYRYGLIPKDEAISFLEEKPETLEVVLTGRDPGEELIRLADYVSEIRKKKHPFDRGITAREGIEY